MNEIKRFTIICPDSLTDKIQSIKALRTLAGLGLRDAKDAVERANISQTFDIVDFPGVSNPSFLIEEQFRILRVNGIKVGGPIQELLEELRQLGSQALLQGEDELANDILQLVLAEKLRRTF